MHCNKAVLNFYLICEIICKLTSFIWCISGVLGTPEGQQIIRYFQDLVENGIIYKLTKLTVSSSILKSL